MIDIFKINEKQLQLLYDFVLLWNKGTSEYTYYDKKLIEILEEYDFLIDYRKEYQDRDFDD